MIIGVDWLHGNEILVKILDQVIIVIANYLFSKLIFLRKNNFMKCADPCLCCRRLARFLSWQQK